jgi:murein DD-endopeptidase MepM/ murein hydrolase activator NlpD
VESKTWVIGAGVAAAAVLVLPLALLLLLFDDAAGSQTCAGSAVVDPDSVPESLVAGGSTFTHEQLVNAAWIITAGADLGLDERDQTIGVMTAIGESSLRVLDYGDAAGPDSRGLFQQRDNWGPLEDRMDPYTSAQLFFNAPFGPGVGGMITRGLNNRPDLSPTEIAHRIQINADPNHYAKYWDMAVDLVNALAGTDPAGCAAAWDGTASDALAWPENPTTVTSGYGPRVLNGVYELHDALDMSAGCGTTIMAAANGTVTAASDGCAIGATGCNGGWGNYVRIDHGTIGGHRTWTGYNHMANGSVTVKAGDTVVQGQVIGTESNTGYSFGCHLHFQVWLDTDAVSLVSDANTDPLTVLPPRP